MKSAAVSLAFATLAVWTGVALAQDTTPPGTPAGTPAPDKAQVQIQQTPPQQMKTQPATPANPAVSPATPADAALQARLGEIRQRGMALPAKDKETVGKLIETEAKEVDLEATSKGEAVIAGRIAGEFGMTPDALQAERAGLNAGWGDLLIAHTLVAGSGSDLTVAQLYQLRREGMGWGEVAHGMGLNVGQALAGIRAEGRVAKGMLKPDGKPAKIAAGTKKASGGAKAGESSRGGKADAAARVGAGSQAEETLPKGQGGK